MITNTGQEALLTESCRRLLCAVLLCAVRDLKSSDEKYVVSARDWLQLPHAATVADLTEITHGDCLVAHATAK